MSNIKIKMTALADEVRDLSGTTTTKSIDAMISDIDTANTEVNTQSDLIAQIMTVLEEKAYNPGTADYSDYDGLITRTITTCNNSRITTIGRYAFQGCSNLTAVNCAQAKTIDIYAFQGCSSLTTVDCAQATAINAYAFQNCVNLTTINFPQVRTIEQNAFQSCYNLNTINIPEVRTMPAEVFTDCINLKSIDLLQLSYIPPSAFQSCSALTSVNCPAAIAIGAQAFHLCKNLTTIQFPLVSRIEDAAFAGCENLITASFPCATHIGSSAFIACFSLASLYLTGSTLCQLGDNMAFIGASNISIYVPGSFINLYKTATNWAFYADKFVSCDGEVPDELTIQFLIDDVMYTADLNMSWRDWVSSDYNTAGFNVVVDPFGLNSSEIVMSTDEMAVQTQNWTVVAPDDIIVADAYYYTGPW